MAFPLAQVAAGTASMAFSEVSVFSIHSDTVVGIPEKKMLQEILHVPMSRYWLSPPASHPQSKVPGGFPVGMGAQAEAAVGVQGV